MLRKFSFNSPSSQIVSGLHQSKLFFAFASTSYRNHGDHHHHHHDNDDHSSSSSSSTKVVLSPAELAKKQAAKSSSSSKFPPPSSTMSGAKREALKLYRNLMKISLDDKILNKLKEKKFFPKKKRDEVSGNFIISKEELFSLNTQQKYIREQFLQNRNIPRSSIEKIQYHVHYGQSKLEELEKGKKNRTGFTVLSFGN